MKRDIDHSKTAGATFIHIDKTSEASVETNLTMSVSWRRCWQLGISVALGIGGAIVSSASCALAQITPDATLGAERSVITPNTNVRGFPAELIEGGATRGANLFHSFQGFNVGDGQRVYFANPAGIENILSRVTGNNLSNILGTLGVDGGANLFLLNPNGIVFGENGRLDIAGSFVASTANALVFENGTSFSATNPEAPPLLKITMTPGLQYRTNQPRATIANSGNLAVGQNLTLSAGNLDLQGQVQAGGDLSLLATDTVRVRDSVVSPFIASANGALLVQGNHAVDIFALSHSDSGLFSGGNMLLRSANTVRGDAHYWSGGNFRIEQLDGSTGKLDSPHDPIILSGGNVSLGDYTGASLHIVAGGSVTLGNVTLTGRDSIGNSINPDNGTLLNETRTLGSLASFNLSDGTPFTINGNENATLDVRAGVDWSQLGGLPTPNPRIFGTVVPVPAFPASPLSADITVTGNIKLGLGRFPDPGSRLAVLLTNQYYPNSLASGGTISTQDISSQLTISGSIFFLLPDAIVMDSRKGIITRDLNNRAVGAINGGTISLMSNEGDIRVGNLSSSAGSFRYDLAGSGGGISITARSGSIGAGNINSSTGALGNAGNGGAIILSALGDINVANVDSHSTNQTNGNGGDITLITTNGNITTGNLSSFSGDYPNPNQPVSMGKGGAISLSATNGAIATKNIYSYATATIAGTVSLNADIIKVEDILALSLYGKGNSIALSANNNITTRSLNTTGQIGSGNITITSNNGVFASVGSVIASDTFGAGKGGDIQITARSVSLTNGAQVSASTHSTGQGGTITLRASETVELSGLTPDGKPPALVFAGNSLTGIPEGQYLGGFIPTTGSTRQIPVTDAQYPSGLFTQTTTDSTGNAGSIEIETGRLLINNQAAIGATTFGQGNAGNLSVTGKNSVSIDNGSILSGVAPGSGGNSGTIDINTSSLSITGGGIVQTQTLGQGNAGNIEVNASYAVTLLGVSPTTGRSSGLISGSQGINSGTGGNITVETGAMHISDGAVLSAKTFSTQRGGDITVNANSLEVLGGGQLLTTTFGSGRAGDIRVSASNSITFAGSDPTYTGRVAQFGDKVVDPDGSASGILARSQGTGRAGQLSMTTQNLTIKDTAQATVSSIGSVTAGNLDVQARHVVLDNQARLTAETEFGGGGNLTLRGLDTLQVNNSLISASTQAGTAGNLTVNATESVQLSGASSLSVEATAGGTAGNLTIETGQMSVQDEARVTVSSRQGQAGNLTITANSLDLNRGTISAETGKSSPEGGANITLKGLELLLMRNESLISASALGNANGGNVTIDSTLIVATPPTGPQGSDIIANAEQGNGGRVNVTTQGLFGIQFRPQRTPKNDITVSSTFGLSGEYVLNTPGVDPSRGLAQLPTNVVDASQQIDRRCTPDAAKKRGSFIITGRGGLPPNPNEPLQGESVITNWVTLDSEENNNTPPAPTTPKSSASRELIEAQGWIINEKGQVVLIATAPNATPQGTWLSPPECNPSQSSSRIP